MMQVVDSKAEYEICRKRKHQKSGKTAGDGFEKWDICKFCATWFRYETILKEQNVPA